MVATAHLAINHVVIVAVNAVVATVHSVINHVATVMVNAVMVNAVVVTNHVAAANNVTDATQTNRL